MAALARPLLRFLIMSVGLTLVSCFIEPAKPGSFRFECSADADCEDGYQCANGLCQQHCGAETDAACDQSSPVCLNSYCSAVCTISDSSCPAPQECMSLSFGSEDASDIGVCVVACDADNPCEDGQVCFEEFGLCVATCMVTEDCGSGEECVMGLCVPTSSSGG